jgi:hypothetical protein
LLPSTDVDVTVDGALKDGGKVTEGVLHIFEVYRLLSEVFEVMHYDLLFVRDKDSKSYPCLIEFYVSLDHLRSLLDIQERP